MTTKQHGKPINILITPSQTLIRDEILKPDSIAIVLENGHAYDIDDVIDILMVHDKKKPSKLRIKRRLQRFTQAFKAALKETDEVDDRYPSPMAVNTLTDTVPTPGVETK